MSKAIKIWLIVATSLVVLGIITFGVVMTMLNWDFTRLGTVKYETNSYETDESFHNISIDTDTADITVLPSDDGRAKVVCYEESKLKHNVSVENDTLIISLSDSRKWYDHIGINFTNQKITVYLPESEFKSLVIEASTADVDISKGFYFGEVDIETSTGDVKIDGVSADNVELSVSTGKIEASDIICGDIEIEVNTGKANLTNVKCGNLISKGNTGDFSLTGVVASEKFNIERTTGDVKFDGCDAKEIHVETDTGNVKGSLLSEKVFIARTDTGRINVPKTTSGGVCEITTDTGDIIINIK